MSYCNINNRIEKRRQINRRNRSSRRLHKTSTKNSNRYNERRRLSNTSYWKQLLDFPSYYINRSGDIYSRFSHRKLKASPSDNGYRTVLLYTASGSTTRTVHTLVLETFVGPKPEGKSIVGRHLDGNPLNNKVSNLCWGTQGDNLRDRNEHGTAVRGDSHPGSRLSSKDIPTIKALVIAGHIKGHIATAFGVSRCTIHNVSTGTSWAHITAPPLPQSVTPQPIGTAVSIQQSILRAAVDSNCLTLKQLSHLYGLPLSTIKASTRCTPNPEAGERYD